MMADRLELGRGLIQRDGIIFVSVNDIEVNRLSFLMKGVFVEETFIGPLIWKSRQNKDNRSLTGLSNDHEYILCFGKKIRGEERNISQYSNPDNDPKGPWVSANMVGILPESERPNCHYDLINPETGINYRKPKMGWRFNKKRIRKLIEEKRILWPDDPKGRPRLKVFLKELKNPYTGSSSVLNAKIFTYHGTKELDNLFGEKILMFPKPSELLKLLIEQACFGLEENSIILDFFAGSGTTAHAVIELNKEDGGKRKYVLGEMANYIDTVMIPRIKKVCYSLNWKDGKPQDEDGISQFFKYQVLEQFEDTLDNIELTTSETAQALFKDDYLLKYYLDYETRGNPSLLNIEMLKNPFAYKLRVNPEEVGEPQEMVVDIPETFNYLLGLKVKKIKAREMPHPSVATNDKRKYLFILGEKEGKVIAIVWREYEDSWSEEDFKRDKEFIIKELASWTPHIVYINGQSVLTPKLGEIPVEVRPSEPEFKRLMEA